MESIKKISILYYAFFVFICCTIAAIYYNSISIILLPFIPLVLAAAFSYYKLIWLVLLATIPFAFEYNITNTLGLDMPDEPLMLLVTGIFLLLVFTKSIQIPKALWTNNIILILILMYIWYGVTSAASSFPLYSFKYMLAKVWYIIPFTLLPIVLLQTKKDFKLVAYCVAIPLVVTVLIILYKHYNRGFLFDNINTAVAPYYRNHVTYAALLVSVMPIVVSIYIGVAKMYKKYVLLVIVILLVALFLSYSRGAWLALVVGLVSVVLVKKGWLLLSFISVMLLIVGITIWLSGNNKYIQYHPNYRKTIYHANLSDHINATFAGTDMSNAERINRWIAGVRMADENKLFGFGPNTFYHNYKPYMVTYFKTWVSDNKEKSTVHNYFLLTLIEQGWVGLLLLFSLISLTMYRLQQLYKRITDTFYKKIILCVTAMLSIILTLNMLSDLVETDKIGSLYYLCIGFTIWLHLKHPTPLPTESQLQ